MSSKLDCILVLLLVCVLQQLLATAAATVFVVAAAGSQASAAAAARSSSNTSATAAAHINPSVVVIVVILSVVFILSGFLHLLARCLGRRRSSSWLRRGDAAYQGSGHELLPGSSSISHTSPAASVSAVHGQLQQLFHLHDSGVEQAFIDTLPVFAYGSIRGLKDSADCAVCLNEFGEDDRLRLLPKCNHAFHLSCIDTWLLSNSTCPLCRRSLLPDDPPAAASSSAAADQLDHQATGTSSSSSRSNSAVSVAVGGAGGPPPAAQSTGAAASSLDPLDEAPPVLRAQSFQRSSFRTGSSLRESSSFRIREEEQEECEIQEVELEQTPMSPMVPRVTVIDANGMSRILTVELGKVKMGSSTRAATAKTTTTAAAAAAGSSSSSSKRTSRTPAATGSVLRTRSYSMGSYEYVVDPSNLQELMIAPTPFPGRPQNWAPSRPTHRSALSDSIPELACSSSSSAAAAAANDDLFWASRGLDTTQPRTLSTVRELLSPSPGRNAFSTSPAAAAPCTYVDYGSSSSPSAVAAVAGEAPAASGRSLYFEAHSGRSLYFEAPSGSFYFEAEDELHSEACSDSFRYQEEEEEEEDELLDEGGGGDEEAAVVAGATAATTSTDSQPQSRGQSFRARIQAALQAQFLFSEAAATSNLTKNHNNHHHNNDNKDLARRSSSLSRLPESKNSVSIYRRSMSETSSSSLQVVDDHVSSTLQNQHELWDCEELLFTAAAAHQGKKKKNMKEVSSSTEGDHTAISIIPPASSMKLSSSKRYTLNWLMGRHRDRRLVYSAATPPPCPQDLQQQQQQHPLADCSDCHLQIPVAATASC
ncbi:unnamed protein product [Sphagnum jensenii]|uniref:RING-type domain-containing protein n=1 Tax=Sphagnum jensenii TaxID=128206 RepID=A0ABP1B1L4_9BRYO